jgi:hypothetical protein
MRPMEEIEIGIKQAAEACCRAVNELQDALDVYKEEKEINDLQTCFVTQDDIERTLEHIQSARIHASWLYMEWDKN